MKKVIDLLDALHYDPRGQIHFHIEQVIGESDIYLVSAVRTNIDAFDDLPTIFVVEEEDGRLSVHSSLTGAQEYLLRAQRTEPVDVFVEWWKGMEEQ